MYMLSARDASMNTDSASQRLAASSHTVLGVETHVSMHFQKCAAFGYEPVNPVMQSIRTHFLHMQSDSARHAENMVDF